MVLFFRREFHGKDIMKISRLLYILAGSLAVLLGFIGTFLPVLPTVPFLLLASFCFARGSEKFERWFKNTGLYKKYLEDFEKNRSMPLKSKILILAFSTGMILFPIIRISNIFIRTSLILLEVFKYYYFIFKIKTSE